MKREAHNKGKKLYYFCTKCGYYILKNSLAGCNCKEPKKVRSYL